jgi:hypothetical protein
MIDPADRSGRADAASRDTMLVVALACGATPTEAAARAGVSRRTAYRRLQDPAFRRRVHRERDTLVAAIVGRLADASLTAVDTLRIIAADEDAAPGPRISSAKAILDVCLRAHEQIELAERIEAVEAHLGLHAAA